MSDYLQSRAVDSGSAANAQLAFTSDVQAGSLLVAVARVSDLGRLVTVTDSLNGAYTQAKFQAGSNYEVHIFHWLNSAAGANTVTILTSGPAGLLRWAILEYRHPLPQAVDRTASNSATSTSPSSGAAVLALAPSVVMGAISTDGAPSITWDAAWTPRVSTTKLSVADRLPLVDTNVQVQGTLGATDTWVAVEACYGQNVSLYQRLLHDPQIDGIATNIDQHSFAGACAEVRRGKLTEADLVAEYGMTAAQATELSTLITRLGSSTPEVLDALILHEILLVAERGIAYSTEAALKSRLGV